MVLLRGYPPLQSARLSGLLSGVLSCREICKREEMTPINTKSNRVFHGGSWGSYARICCAGHWFYSGAPDNRYLNRGLRLSMRYVRGKKK